MSSSPWLAPLVDKCGMRETTERVRCFRLPGSKTSSKAARRVNCLRVGTCRRSARLRSNVNVQRTNVVIIGNGPSGICLSYMLSGNWPFITTTAHPDEMLTARLQDVDLTKSLLLQDLQYLSDGLEGRTSNPVALLFDALSNPHADFGARLASLLRWEFRPEREIPHVVLGRYDEGGIWQTVENHVQTLSLAEWMELPGLTFAEWHSNYSKEHTSTMDIHTTTYSSPRASAAEVRQYYRDYVVSQRLSPYFVNRVVVTSVKRVYDDCSELQADCESGEADMHSGMANSRRVVWEVRGYRAVDGLNTAESSDQEEFFYRSPVVVLAAGAYAIPNALHVPGETRPFVLHSVTELDDRIRHGELHMLSDPLVVVGGGLSAADAILRARAEGISVAHVFRRSGRDNLTVYRQLPPHLYPEYDAVYRLMCSNVIGPIDGYSSYPNAVVVDFTSNNEVLLRCDGVEGNIVIRTSFAVVLIGSRPNLSFLQGDELEIGVIPGVAVDGKHNPVDVDPWTYQSHRLPGLYAVGPLVGDGFVRFLRGGAFAVTSHLWQQREKQADPVETNRPTTEITCF